MGQNSPFRGGLEGPKMSFLGPKPTQDPMNIVFEQKKYLGKKISGPPTEKNFGPGPAGPAGSPKVVQIVPLGSLTLLKRSGTLKNDSFDYVEIFFEPKLCPKHVFGLRWGFLAVLGRAKAESL